jgi:hypothetical protein
MSTDSQLLDYLTKRSLVDLSGVKIIKLDHQNFPTCEYINLVVRMGIDTVTANELNKAGFHLYRAYNLSLEDHHIYFEFMRMKNNASL